MQKGEGSSMRRKTRRNAARRVSNAVSKISQRVDIPIVHRPCARAGLAGLALGSLAWSGSLHAADAPAAAANEPVQEIVVTGLRESLKNAQALKNDSDIIQDSISAQDIGALPDQSVTETFNVCPVSS